MANNRSLQAFAYNFTFYNPGQNSWATYVQTGPKTTPAPPVNVGRTNHSARCAVGNNIAEGRGMKGALRILAGIVAVGRV